MPTWIKYNTNHASGSAKSRYQLLAWDKNPEDFGSEEEWKNDIDIEEFIELKHQEYYWSDKYRGVTIDLVPHPPLEILSGMLEDEIKSLKYTKKNIERFKNLIKEILKDGWPKADKKEN